MDGPLISFEEDFADFLCRRTCEELAKIIVQSKEYEQYMANTEEHGSNMKAMMPEDRRDEFQRHMIEYENTNASMCDFYSEVHYLEGIKDGVKLARILEIKGLKFPEILEVYEEKQQKEDGKSEPVAEEGK